VFEETTLFIKRTRILLLKIKSSLLRENGNCIRGTNPIYLENTNILSKEQISSTQRKEYAYNEHLVFEGNKNIVSGKQISSTQGTRKFGAKREQNFTDRKKELRVYVNTNLAADDQGTKL
jgi:hypothetical protein